jgi:hypothetical protein
MAKYALIFLWLLQTAVAIAAPPSPPHAVQSLDYGMALYANFQDQPVEALTQLMAAEQRGRFTQADVFPKLLMGNLSLTLGLTQQAEKIFFSLQKDTQFHDAVSFYLGKFYYYQQQPQPAVKFLNNLTQLNDEQTQERLYYLAMLAMQSKQLSLAQDYDAQLNKKSVWKNYVTHNLALANAAQQDFKSAHQLWQGLLKQDDADVELALLQQRARLAQGLIFLQQQQLQQAQKTLQALPQTTLWLAASILALAASEDNPEHAQQQLDWLQSLPGHDYEKSQGLQLSAQLAEQQKNYALAWQRYQSSLSAYQQQQTLLTVLQQQKLDEVYQQWLQQQTPAAISSLLETDDTLQQQRKQGVQFVQLQNSLEKNAQRLPELQWMLTARQQAHQQRLNNVALQTLQSRQQSLQTQYAALNNSQQPWQLASPTLLAQQQKWQQAQQMVQRNPSLPNAAVIQARLQRLQGALLWQLQEQGLVEQLSINHARREIAAALADNQRHLQNIQQLMVAAPDYAVLSQRVRDYQQKIAATSQQLQQMQTQFQQQTKARIGELLTQQQQIVQTHIADVHYQLARLSEAAL